MTTRRMAVTRAIVSVGATLALVAGVTFANLSSTATLTNNTLATASADLQVQTDGGFGSSANGFQVTNVVPGSDTQVLLFNLKNNGGVPLGVTAHIPTVPTYSGFTDFSKVDVTIERNSDSSVVKATNLADLINGNVTIESLNASDIKEYKLVVNVHTDAVTGSSAQINSFDIVFTGTQS